MIHFKIYKSVNELPKQWNALNTDDVFLNTTFLQALELASPLNIKSYYILIFKEDNCVGKAVFQHIKFVLDADNKEKKGIIKEITKKTIKAIAKGDLLVLGNLMQTGQHGYFFNEEVVSFLDFFESLEKASKNIQETIYSRSKKHVKAVLLKDYFKFDVIHKFSSDLAHKNYFKIAVQPNMILNVKEEWKSMLDYQSALQKKYRHRYKSALKKKTVVVKDLSESDLKYHEKSIYKLYKNVSKNASINSFTLPKHHFYTLKIALKDSFKVYGYFLDDVLVGFFTLIENDAQLETYFLGYNSQLNHKHQLYLNMLYDMIAYAINNNFKQVIFARTAMEIKSSVGAKPIEMDMYMKHTQSLLNSVLKFSMNFMTPKQNWKERNAFK